ncbi:phage tail protein [Halomonas aquamarina]|uniref:Phage tail protein n=1 Tax=Vreelandella aquamarina TaxID=77097 RepID=A0ACC5VYA2_9GAMM|nr:phage tail tube protein [Halomonas aquamarina]MBZ5489143.1 phage tail protein [Halomonas aquamarina]
MLTKGTSVFFQAPGGEIVRVKRLTAFNPGSSPKTQIDQTDLEETQAMRYEAGLAQPGQGSLAINADPAEPSHIALQQMAEGGQTPTLKWFVGWSDGPVDAEGKQTAAPEASGDTITLPTTRTWYTFDAYIADFPFDFQLNANVVVAGSLQRSGRGTWQRKAAQPPSGE